MWVFGYGSLMWDGWESSRGCIKRIPANLFRYRRIFNKASVKNWGTKKLPGPTLNLISEKSSICWGIAFKFSYESRDILLSYLRKREGKGFSLDELEIKLDSGRLLKAIVPIYVGQNLLDDSKSLEEIAEMIKRAKGISGYCLDYVKGIVKKLDELKIEDQYVSEIWQLINPQ